MDGLTNEPTHKVVKYSKNPIPSNERQTPNEGPEEGGSDRAQNDGPVKPSDLQGLLKAPETIDFTDVKRLVIEPYCIQCHSKGERRVERNIDLSTYELTLGLQEARRAVVPGDVKSSLFFDTMITEGGRRQMPPSNARQLEKPDDEISLVRKWIENGAPKQYIAKVKPDTPSRPAPDPQPADPTPRPTPSPVEPTLKQQLQPYFANPESIDYKVVNKYLFKPHCASCHSENSPSKEQEAIDYSANMTDYKSLFDPFLTVIEKGSEEKSKLYRSVAIKQSMPPDYDGYDPVDSLLVKLFRLWIINCAIEDYSSVTDDRLQSPDRGKVRTCKGQ